MTERTELDLPAGTTRDRAVAIMRKAFTQAGLDDPALEARVLACAALAIDAVALLTRPGEPLRRAEAERLSGYAGQRLRRMPVQRILGRAEFWGLPFRLGPDTLVPRPDTETVVSEALALLPDFRAALRILDLGTGSGCILVALLHELPGASGLGIDRSPAALDVAQRNAAINGVGARAAFAASDWGSAVSGTFDLVVSNPPYIRPDVIAALEPEVRDFEPPAALDGGPDGLGAYRIVLDDVRRMLAPGGLAVLEMGHDQGQAVSALARERGLAPVRLGLDLGGNTRTVGLRIAP